jgi:hypothetical protein
VTQDLVHFQRAISKEFDGGGTRSEDSMEVGGSMRGDGQVYTCREQISEVALLLKDQGKVGRV